jgi:hypothetical protein
LPEPGFVAMSTGAGSSTVVVVELPILDARVVRGPSVTVFSSHATKHAKTPPIKIDRWMIFMISPAH